MNVRSCVKLTSSAPILALLHAFYKPGLPVINCFFTKCHHYLLIVLITLITEPGIRGLIRCTYAAHTLHIRCTYAAHTLHIRCTYAAQS